MPAKPSPDSNTEDAASRTAQAAERTEQTAQRTTVAAERSEASADRRTEPAADRTVLAAERTYAAWVRTGLMSLTVGVGAKKTLGGVLPEWMVVLTGSVLVAFAAFCFAAAVWRELYPGTPPPRPDVRRLPRALLFALNGFSKTIMKSLSLGLTRVIHAFEGCGSWLHRRVDCRIKSGYGTFVIATAKPRHNPDLRQRAAVSVTRPTLAGRCCMERCPLGGRTGGY